MFWVVRKRPPAITGLPRQARLRRTKDVANKSRILGIPNRYFILLFIIIGVLVHFVFEVGVLAPHVQLPAEKFSEGGFLTNTLVATFLADIVLILLAFFVFRAAPAARWCPKAFPEQSSPG
jgi:hypothetical protein